MSAETETVAALANSAYAIVRLDYFDGWSESRLGESAVTVKKIVFGLNRARREVDRLNGLGKKHCLYFFQYTRIEAPDEYSDIGQPGWDG